MAYCMVEQHSHKLTKQTFFSLGIMSGHSFQDVAWRQVYNALDSVPQLFQLWACKQVMEVAGTNLNQSLYMKGHDPHCPSCAQALKSCSRVLHCEEAGRVDALQHSFGWLDDWLRKVGTKPTLQRALMSYV